MFYMYAAIVAICSHWAPWSLNHFMLKHFNALAFTDVGFMASITNKTSTCL